MQINRSYVVRLILGLLSVLAGLAVSRVPLTFTADLLSSNNTEWLGIFAAVLVAAGIFVASSVVLSGVRKKPAEETVNVQAVADWFEECERHDTSQREARARDAQAGVPPFPPSAAATSTPSSERRGVWVTAPNRRTAV